MARPLLVWGWQGWRTEAGPQPQTREIVAARSMAEVARLAGEKYPRNLFCLEETGNDDELRTALAAPGVIFWRQLDDRHGPWRSEKDSSTHE